MWPKNTRRERGEKSSHDPDPVGWFLLVLSRCFNGPDSAVGLPAPTSGWIETLTLSPWFDPCMSDSPVDPAAVEHVAELARVDLDEEELTEFAAQFAEILKYFEALDEVPAVDAEPELVNVMRTDAVRDGLTQEEALRNAPETEDGFFKGPTVS